VIVAAAGWAEAVGGGVVGVLWETARGLLAAAARARRWKSSAADGG
jgi:hypothetical protein